MWRKAVRKKINRAKAKTKENAYNRRIINSNKASQAQSRKFYGEDPYIPSITNN